MSDAYINVCAAVLLHEGKLLLTTRRPGGHLAGCWEFPGGKVKVNETHEQTIVREIKEELMTDIIPIKYIGKAYYEYTELNKPFSITLYAYECALVGGNLELTEHTEKRWVNKCNLSKLVFANADLPIIDLLNKNNT